MQSNSVQSPTSAEAHMRVSTAENIFFPSNLYPFRRPLSITSVANTLPTESWLYQTGKRTFDIVFALLLLPVTAVFVGILSLAIFLTSGGPVFFRQQRVGKHGRPFLIWKMRTMHTRLNLLDGERGGLTAGEQREWALHHKLRHDRRTTRLGKFLRAVSFDELPQIINILTGEMSFVGPRPITDTEIPKYSAHAAYYLAAKPGVTGLWQVSGRSRIPYETRVLLDVSYVKNWTMGKDLVILLQTPGAVLRRDGAY